MKETLEFILKHALPKGVEFSVRQIEDETGVTFDLTIPEEYRGRIIGKGGVNIKAIRNVLNILAKKDNQRIFIKILD
jgi:predicted RNA-binding protein YlqC (UPF0109 family)